MILMYDHLTKEEKILAALKDSTDEQYSRQARQSAAFVAARLLKEYLEDIKLILEVRKQ